MIRKTLCVNKALWLVSMVCLMGMISQVAAATEKLEYNTEYSKKGADTCLKCHDETNKYPIFPLFSTKHGEINDARSPMAKLQCETCHGPVGEHNKKPSKGEKRAPIIAFGKNSWVPTAKQNSMCLQCHADQQRLSWQGSSHQLQDMACVNCHVVHKAQDPMLAATEQVPVCLKCHVRQRAQFQKTSSHPIRYGQIKCSQCHNPHGSFGDKVLLQESKNQLCYTCHAEKRGPFLWSHAPVMEDCTICHQPHGSIHPSLLIKRAPLLCQQCHSVAGHPSVAYSGSGLANATPSQFLLAKSCLNCHSQIHGSNNPSGVKLMR